MKIETTTLESFSERRKIREEPQRSGAEGGPREDVAVLCRCPDCGTQHYRKRDESSEKVK
jgi:hypothetical protein